MVIPVAHSAHFADVTKADSTCVSLAIVGAGMACARLVRELVDAGFPGNNIAVFGDEPHAPYNRVQLSAVLAGDTPKTGITMLDREWCQQQGVQLFLGDKVETVDTEQRRLALASGAHYQFEKLVFATGSNAIWPPIQGSRLNGVMVFRSVDDVEALLQFSQQAGQNAVIVGGGLLGLEAAYGLQKLGVQTHVVNRADYVMNRQIDFAAGQLLARHLEKLGIRLYDDNSVEEIYGDIQVESVRLTSGDIIPCSLVVFAIGISANAQLAIDTPLIVNRGIVVDQYLQTSIPGIYALGECAEYDNETVGIVAPIWQQVSSLVATLMEQPTGYQHQAHATQLKVSGIDVFAAGQCPPQLCFVQEADSSDCSVAESSESVAQQADIVIQDPQAGVYRRLAFTEQQLTGAVLMGDRSHGLDYEKIINQINGQPNNDHLMFDTSNPT